MKTNCLQWRFDSLQEALNIETTKAMTNDLPFWILRARKQQSQNILPSAEYCMRWKLRQEDYVLSNPHTHTATAFSKMKDTHFFFSINFIRKNRKLMLVISASWFCLRGHHIYYRDEQDYRAVRPLNSTQTHGQYATGRHRPLFTWERRTHY